MGKLTVPLKSVIAVWLGCNTLYSTAATQKDYDACILDSIEAADDSATIADIKRSCTTHAASLDSEPLPPKISHIDQSSIEGRLNIERKNRERGYIITPHYPNYLLPFTHNTDPNEAPFIETDPEAEVDEDEIMIQVSVKFPVAIDLWDSNTDLMVA